MGVCQPAQELGHVVIVLGPENKVPMIGHQTESQQAYRMFVQGLDEHPLDNSTF
jgi:hypothetical protein